MSWTGSAIKSPLPLRSDNVTDAVDTKTCSFTHILICWCTKKNTFLSPCFLAMPAARFYKWQVSWSVDRFDWNIKSVLFIYTAQSHNHIVWVGFTICRVTDKKMEETSGGATEEGTLSQDGQTCNEPSKASPSGERVTFYRCRDIGDGKTEEGNYPSEPGENIPTTAGDKSQQLRWSPDFFPVVPPRGRQRNRQPRLYFRANQLTFAS